MFERVKPMLTIHDFQIPALADRQDLRNPMCRENKVWRVISPSSLVNGFSQNFSRPTDVTGILDDISLAVGPPTAMCVLGSNVIGAADWERVPFERQYQDVTQGAAAFVASNMLYLRVSGQQAAGFLDMLTPRTVQNLAQGHAMFVLFTTPAGTVDEEAVVLRTGPEEYLVSCGGGKMPSGLQDALEVYSQVSVEHSDFVSFNLKGPQRMTAMQTLVQPEFKQKVASLKPFQAFQAGSLDGNLVWVVRTVVGLEMWGRAPVIRAVWESILSQPTLITPCGWNLLNVYRMECNLMVFAVYPLDVHSGTTLWETGYGWMIDRHKATNFIGKSALKQSHGKERLWLAGLSANDMDQDVLPVGSEIYTREGKIAGYVTSAAWSIKYQRALAFAHIEKSCQRGDTLTSRDGSCWTVCSLPFS